MKKYFFYAFLILSFITGAIHVSLNFNTSEPVQIVEDPTWNESVVIDKFGDSTDQTVFVSQSTGKINDNENLSVSIEVNDEGVFLYLSQTALNIPETLPHQRIINRVEVLKSDGTKEKIKLFGYGGVLADFDGKLLELLTTETEPFKIHINLLGSGYGFDSQYLFPIDPDGFKELIDKKEVAVR